MTDLKAISAECIRFSHQREHSYAQGYHDALVDLPILAEDMNNASYLSGRIGGLFKRRGGHKKSRKKPINQALD